MADHEKVDSSTRQVDPLPTHPTPSPRSGMSGTALEPTPPIAAGQASLHYSRTPRVRTIALGGSDPQFSIIGLPLD